MDADQLKCKWIQFKRALKTRWGRFRDDHLVQSEGSYAKFVDKAHERLMKGADAGHPHFFPPSGAARAMAPPSAIIQGVVVTQRSK